MYNHCALIKAAPKSLFLGASELGRKYDYWFVNRPSLEARISEIVWRCWETAVTAQSFADLSRTGLDRPYYACRDQAGGLGGHPPIDRGEHREDQETKAFSKHLYLYPTPECILCYSWELFWAHDYAHAFGSPRRAPEVYNSKGGSSRQSGFLG